MDTIERYLLRQQGYLQAITSLLALQYDDRGGSERIELLLARNGLDYQQIAEVLNKKPDAVRMFLKRNKPTKTPNS